MARCFPPHLHLLPVRDSEFHFRLHRAWGIPRLVSPPAIAFRRVDFVSALQAKAAVVAADFPQVKAREFRLAGVVCFSAARFLPVPGPAGRLAFDFDQPQVCSAPAVAARSVVVGLARTIVAVAADFAVVAGFGFGSSAVLIAVVVKARAAAVAASCS